jgi:Flp pilus assembly protein TadG
MKADMTRERTGASFLTRLGRDAAGNTIALAAAAMIPLAGLIGGGVDMSRLYLTKTRLQHACDAGALAGRKVMGAGAWTTGGTTSAQARANELFATNFKANAYGTGTLTRSYTESNGTVTGNVSVAVPMTIMRVFGMGSRDLAVTCTAKMEIPNTDVMFVLDVTGSMNCVAGDPLCGNNGNVPAVGAKILGLKSAVKCFYEALLKVNTAEVCGNDPTATTYSGTAQIRMGFMPYSVNVNVGKLLPNDAIANSWAYQSRQANFTDQPVYSANSPTVNGPYWEAYTDGWGNQISISQTQCLGYMKNEDFDGWGGFSPTATSSGGPAPTATVATTFPHDGDATSGGSSGEWGWTGASDTNGNSRSCRRLRTNTTTTYTQTGTTQVFSNWTYKQVTFNVSGLKAGGGSWNSSVALPIGSSGTNTNVSWTGCIEERQASATKNSDHDPSNEWSTIPSDANDMNIDLLPDPNVAGTQWGPQLRGAVYFRGASTDTISNVTSSSNFSQPTHYCTTEAKKLQTWYTPSSFVTYVDSLTAIGNTYHDIGMIWGARFISPTGIFASENAQTNSGGAIQRHIIFMTDGDTMSRVDDYSAYGISWWDRRQTTYAPVDDEGGGAGLDSSTARMINAHLTALCTAIKNKNITLWVIGYGGAANINSATTARLQACATSGKYFAADDTEELISNFKQIASEIAELRLTS